MKFEMTHKFFPSAPPEVFTELTAPAWLTGDGTIRGSTMDCRWFWAHHVLTLEVGETAYTDFRRVRRIE